jgi:hypothetical protein
LNKQTIAKELAVKIKDLQTWDHKRCIDQEFVYDVYSNAYFL